MVACQAPLSVEFSRQEYWSGLPCPPPGDFPNPGIEPASLVSPALAGEFFTLQHLESPCTVRPPQSLLCHTYSASTLEDSVMHYFETVFKVTQATANKENSVGQLQIKKPACESEHLPPPS